MANRLKEDEKNEKIIRGLLKLPENRRCINCDSLGPQYVCTNFWTFICTNCSGIHREFTHRVKSISMAKFTTQEVNALQEGGNQRAKDIYFKEWDPQRNSLPASSNIDRLRDFIRHVYVDRRYSGERNYDKPPRGKMGEKEEFSEKGSRSPPPHEDGYDHRGGRSFDERRSPGNEQEARKFGAYRRSPSEPQIINDWRREDRFGNGRRFEDHRSSDRDYKSEGQSPEQAKDVDSSSPPAIRPVRDILGDNVLPLRINEPPKTNVGRTADGSTNTVRTAPSSNFGSTTGTKKEVKLESTGSLIDFDADPEPTNATVPQAQPNSVAPPITQPANAVNDNNWASFDFSPKSKAPQASSDANILDSVLSQLSMPGPAYVNSLVSQSGSNILAAPSAVGMVSVPTPGGLAFQTTGQVPGSSFPSSVGPVASASGLSTVPPPNPGLVTMAPNSVQHQQSGNQPFAQHMMLTSAGTSVNQAWSAAFAPVTQAPVGGLIPQSSHVVSQPMPETTSGIASQSTAPEVKSSSRKALPENLFTTSFSPFPASVPWNMGPSHGMVYSMQYNVPAPNVPQSTKLGNPFDSSGETHPVQALTFPSMSSLQGNLPNLLPPRAGLMHAPGMGTPTPAWMPQQASAFGSALPLQVPSHSLAMAPGAYAGQVPANVSHTGYPGAGGFGNDGAAFGPSNPDQMLAARFPAPAAPSPFSSSGGNPFG